MRNALLASLFLWTVILMAGHAVADTHGWTSPCMAYNKPACNGIIRT